MANEITVNLNMEIKNGFFAESIRPGQIRIDQSGEGRSGVVQTIGTSEEVVAFTEISTEGVLYMRNLDDTNFVRYGPERPVSILVYFGKLKPGEYALFRLAPGVVMRAQADTAAVKLDVRLYED